ncbi:MAG: creatininase family protein [Fimbriimonas sp.]
MRYVDAFPEELDAAWERGACAVLPIGALEWHGSHLPFGTDGLIASWFASSLASRVSGVLLPALYAPITTLPHRHSLQVSTETFRRLIDEMVAGLYGSGCRSVAVVTGHYAQGHMVELYEAALRAMDDFEGLRVFVGTPLEVLGRDELLDHAGRYEASQLLVVRLDLVRLSSLPSELVVRRDAVLGEDPRLGSAEEGARLLSEALDEWVRWLGASTEEVREGYGGRFDALQGYVDAFYEGSWEEAIVKWWEGKA